MWLNGTVWVFDEEVLRTDNIPYPEKLPGIKEPATKKINPKPDLVKLNSRLALM